MILPIPIPSSPSRAPASASLVRKHSENTETIQYSSFAGSIPPASALRAIAVEEAERRPGRREPRRQMPARVFEKSQPVYVLFRLHVVAVSADERRYFGHYIREHIYGDKGADY